MRMYLISDNTDTLTGMELVKTVRTEYKKPLLIEIPDRHGTGRRPDFITAYVNDAIGLKL